ncbi:hypothetical protein WJX72_005784 [[Myrmecia] bisecta]|uniref:Uncharacterized protein n=1 Tax=[Myrmecia] bisecta TaxID=41462 RepID=A0AAW1PSX1_9CHLO
MPPNTTAQPAVESPPLPPDPEPQAMQQQGPQQEMPDFGARIHAEFRDREDVTNAMHAARHAMLYPDYPPQTAKPQQRMGIGFAPPARLPPPIALPPPDMGRRHLHLPEHAPRLSYPHPNLLPGRGMGRDPGMPPWDHLPPPVGEHVPPYQPPGRYFGDYQ